MDGFLMVLKRTISNLGETALVFTKNNDGINTLRKLGYIKMYASKMSAKFVFLALSC